MNIQYFECMFLIPSLTKLVFILIFGITLFIYFSVMMYIIYN